MNVDKKIDHLVCFSGGHSSALVAIYCVDKYGKDNVTLLNHDINPNYEDADIKRFKQEVADYLGLPITYANINNIQSPELIPDQFDVCMKAGALTDIKTQQALCTALLKTEPFYDFLNMNYLPYNTLFEEKKDCVIYYGFDSEETERMQRRSSILGAMGYKTAYPIAHRELRITDTRQIGIEPPSTYSIFKHANCIGCLKAGLLHWYVVYCIRPDVYAKGIVLEDEVDFTIHRVTRNKVTSPISLRELGEIFKQMKADRVPSTEHQSAKKFGHLLRKYQITECNINKPCECTESA